MKTDIRWIQRFSNFRKALTQLENAVLLGKKRQLSELEGQGLIKSFEFTYELCWLTIKDFFEHQGEIGVSGSRDAFKIAFQRGIIKEGEAWMEMIESRKKSVHTYEEEMAKGLVKIISKKYPPLFKHLEIKLEEERSGGQPKLL